MIFPCTKFSPTPAIFLAPMAYRKNRPKSYEEKRITNYFKISNEKYRLCYTPKGGNKSVSILLNYHISIFGFVLRQIIQLKKYNTIKIYTKSMYIHEDEGLNNNFFKEIVVDDYTYQIYDLDLIRSSQELSYSLFCKLEKKSIKC